MKKDKGKAILFMCTGNACRSQMAEGFARAIFPDDWKIYSAGTIAAGLHPLTVEAMREAGVDISRQYSKTIEAIPVDELNCVVTLCGDARDRCPASLTRHSCEHWPIEDPTRLAGIRDPMPAFRRVRDDIRRRVEELAERLKGA